MWQPGFECAVAWLTTKHENAKGEHSLPTPQPPYVRAIDARAIRHVLPARDYARMLTQRNQVPRVDEVHEIEHPSSLDAMAAKGAPDAPRRRGDAPGLGELYARALLNQSRPSCLLLLRRWTPRRLGLLQRRELWRSRQRGKRRLLLRRFGFAILSNDPCDLFHLLVLAESWAVSNSNDGGREVWLALQRDSQFIDSHCAVLALCRCGGGPRTAWTRSSRWR